MNESVLPLAESEEQFLEAIRQELESSGLYEGSGIPGWDWDSHINLYYHHFLQARSVDNASIFAEFLGWSKSIISHKGLPEESFSRFNEAFRRALRTVLSADQAEEALRFFEQGFNRAEVHAQEQASYLDPQHTLGREAIDYLQLLLEGNRREAGKLITGLVEAETDIREIYLHIFQPTQYEIGRLWQLNEITVGQEHFCTAATQMIMSELYPHIFGTDRNGHRIVATAIGGELHEIGVRMVTDFFEMEGWDTFYLGANCPANEIIAELIDRQADLLALSVTLTQHVEKTNELIAKVREVGELDNLKIMVGGYPYSLDDQLWRKSGADGYAANAKEAIEIAKKLVQP